MRGLLVWVALVVVFDLGFFVALREVVQPVQVSADVGARPTPDLCSDPSQSNTAATMNTEDLNRQCLPTVQRNGAMEPTMQSRTCNNVRVQIDPKTLDEMCDVISMACDQQTYMRICPPLSDRHRDGN